MSQILKLILTASALGASAIAGCPDLPSYHGLPARYGFPKPVSELIAIRTALNGNPGQKAAARKAELQHAWDLLAAVTSPVSQVCADVPVWRTWFSSEEVLPPPQFNPTRELLQLFRLAKPSQITQQELEALEQERGPLFSKVYFNRGTRDHIRRLGLAQQATLRGLVAKGIRDVPEFPNDAIAIKTVWRRVPADPAQSLALGVWDPSYASLPPVSGRIPESTWGTCVRVTLGPVTGSAPCGNLASGSVVTGNVIGVDNFFHFTVQDPAAVQQLIPQDERSKLAAGDVLILVGMHLTTKEIPDWFWATYWWRGISKTPPDGQPPELGSRPYWKDFIPDATVSMTYPLEPPGQGPTQKVIYNPYLEVVGAVNGTSSNCMVCHSRAAYQPDHTADPGSVDPLRQAEPLNKFEGRIRTGFLWSIERHAEN